MDGPAVFFGWFFVAGGVFCLLAPWVWVWQYRRFVARSVRVGAHIVDVEVEKTWTGKETIYEYHARVAFVAEDGRELVVPLDLPQRVEPGAEVWLLHDRDRPEKIKLEEKPGQVKRAIASSVIGVGLFGFLAYLMFQVGGVVPEILPLD